MNETNELFARNLNMLLKYYEMSQATLAEKLGYGHAAVSTWCRGEKFPKMKTIDAMTEIFHCKRSDLLERESTPQSIKESAVESELYEYMRKLNQEGKANLLEYMKNMHPKFYEVENV